MRKYIGILVCLVWSISISAFDYQPVTCSAPSTDFRSTSMYRASAGTTGLSAISASNFSALNSEGGACYQPSMTKAGPRKGRPGGGGDSGGGAIGEYDFHSPVGDTPWILVLLFSIAYFAVRLKSKKQASH